MMESSNYIEKVRQFLKVYRRIIVGALGLLIFLTAYWTWLDYRNFCQNPFSIS